MSNCRSNTTHLVEAATAARRYARQAQQTPDDDDFEQVVRATYQEATDCADEALRLLALRGAAP